MPVPNDTRPQTWRRPHYTALVELVKVVVTVPVTHADTVRDSLAAAGAGRAGNYSACSFSSVGIGRFRPEPGATPWIGVVGLTEQVSEERIEVTSTREDAASVVAAVRRAHPYEEPVIDIYPLVNPDSLF